MPHNGPDVFENILVLCPNHHAEFDYGLIAIDVDDFRVLHKDSKNIYKGKKIKIIPDHALNADYLLYHIKNIFEKRVI
jgi:5-methylcytosine-specific restriction protein A